MHWRRQSKGKKINYKNWWYFFLFSSHFLRFSLLSFPVVFTFFTNFLSILSFMFPFPFYSCPCHPFFNSFLSFPKTYYFHQQKIQSTDNTPIAKEYLIMHFACNINFPFSILASKFQLLISERSASYKNWMKVTSWQKIPLSSFRLQLLFSKKVLIKISVNSKLFLFLLFCQSPNIVERT